MEFSERTLFVSKRIAVAAEEIPAASSLGGFGAGRESFLSLKSSSASFSVVTAAS